MHKTNPDKANNHPVIKVSTKDLLINTTLELIEENGGCRGVNLRQIADRIGMAHTCLYHYFESLESLYWAALDRALEWQMSYTYEAVGNIQSPQEKLKKFIESQITCARMHPALYRLFWVEPIKGSPQPCVVERTDQMINYWVRIICTAISGRIAPENMRLAGQLIHSYFHGEMCIYVGRAPILMANQDAEKRILENTLKLVDIITAYFRPTAK
jgi:AcrR family transcriptional regulator